MVPLAITMDYGLRHRNEEERRTALGPMSMSMTLEQTGERGDLIISKIPKGLTCRNPTSRLNPGRLEKFQMESGLLSNLDLRAEILTQSGSLWTPDTNIYA